MGLKYSKLHKTIPVLVISKYNIMLYFVVYNHSK